MAAKASVGQRATVICLYSWLALAVLSSLASPPAVWLQPEVAGALQPSVAIDRLGSLETARKLEEILSRVGPNMRASSDYHDFQDIGLNETLLAWRKLDTQARRFVEQRVAELRPKVVALLAEARVSDECRRAANVTLDAMQRLDSWAVQRKCPS